MSDTSSLPPNLAEARQLFWDFACSHFFMAHDGEIERYRTLGATPEHEAAWRREYIQYWVGRLALDDLTALNQLSHAQAGEALADLLPLAGQGDSFAQLWYANAIWELAGTREAGALEPGARQTALAIWQALTTQPIVLAAAHLAQVQSYLAGFGAATPEEYIRTYAAGKLDHARKGFKG